MAKSPPDFVTPVAEDMTSYLCLTLCIDLHRTSPMLLLILLV